MQLILLAPLALAVSPPAFHAGAGAPFDFSEADALLEAELPALSGHVAVQLRQDGHELYRFQAGDIDHDSRTRLASFTKTISAGVVLALADRGQLDLEQRLGDALPSFEAAGIGAPTVRDAWSMRHGITALRPYERLARFDLQQSVARIAATGSLQFEPGTQLGYDGKGMQSVGLICEQYTGRCWEELARNLIFDPVGMPSSDYQQFSPNPAVAGGLRSSADETLRYAQMVLDGGVLDGRRVLSEAAVETLFTNHTRGLPVFSTPWPESHPLYPMGEAPNYAFGAWVLAEDRDSGHVQELVGAGAWGSYIWIDRSRGLTAVLITDIPAGTGASMDAALGLFDVARREVQAKQVRDLAITATERGARLTFTPPEGSDYLLVYGADDPLEDLGDLRESRPILRTQEAFADVPHREHYAVTAVFRGHENTALIPGTNTGTP